MQVIKTVRALKTEKSRQDLAVMITKQLKVFLDIKAILLTQAIWLSLIGLIFLQTPAFGENNQQIPVAPARQLKNAHQTSENNGAESTQTAVQTLQGGTESAVVEGESRTSLWTG